MFKDDDLFEEKSGTYGNSFKAVENIKKKLNIQKLMDFQKNLLRPFPKHAKA